MKLQINGYSFGKMIVDEKEFTSDLIIHPDGRIQDNWWRSKGHNLLLDDITTVFDVVPEKLVIGTGASGMMKVSEKVLELCNIREIEVEICPTAKAVTQFNEAMEAGTVVTGCFHLTC
ncbi:MAG: hypothetical protein GY860_16950 [Desulfobacteraceae bacterium]|nr:hypothetical protein [Desulfobacteraceae bacterium]